ncbi:expressed unknown protein [Seminavis robusta]|uniref:Uncharacterized protein n=1 Tax=Seminavis robusta TaxID=568900 RepID=A0A9N8F260_9STRA|nr:expressed unknown protein [Seminavis robusta]CAB9529244.1 expressed unknown protein [Seminavis robusta]|eukprot:Sro2440_g327710.1 n/a (240) ;mRNA; f:931-1650
MSRQDKHFTADWDSFDGDDGSDYYSEEGDFSQDMSVGTDHSPVDVAAFPSSVKTAMSIRQEFESAKSMEQKIAARLSLPSTNRRSTISGTAPAKTNRLPKKSRSLEGAAKKAVAALASQTPEDRRLVRRTKSDLKPRGSRESEEAGPPRRGRRHGGRRTGTSSVEHSNNSSSNSNNDNSSPRKSPRKSSRRQSGAKKVEESPLERAQRIKELSLAFQAATMLEKSIAPKTEHLKKDVLM